MRVAPVGATGLGTEGIEGGEDAVRRDLKDGALAMGASAACSSVKIAVPALYKCGQRTVTVCALRLGTEAVERGQGALRCNFEDRAAAALAGTARTAVVGCAIEKSVSAERKSCLRTLSV